MEHDITEVTSAETENVIRNMKSGKAKVDLKITGRSVDEFGKNWIEL